MRFFYFTLSVLTLSCVNPFAPGLDTSGEESVLLGDQRTSRLKKLPRNKSQAK